MNPRLVEGPEQARFRQHCEQALDRRGFPIVDPPEEVSMSSDLGLKAQVFTPDVQSIDGQSGVRRNFFVRPAGTAPDAPPGWLVNYAHGVASSDRELVYLITERTSGKLERSCRVKGVGLWIVREDLSLEERINPEEAGGEQPSLKWATKVRGLRRELVNRLEIEIAYLDAKYQTVRDTTARWDPTVSSPYESDLIQSRVKWQTWAENLSARIDELLTSGHEEEFDRIEAEIAKGYSG